MNKDLRGAITSGKLTLINVGSIIVLRPIVICRDVDVDPDPVGSGLIWLSGFFNSDPDPDQVRIQGLYKRKKL